MNEEKYQQQIPSEISAEQRPPSLITIFTILLLVDGIFTILGALLAFLIGGIVLGGLIGILGIGKIAAAIGLRKMRKWAIYIIAVITVIGILLLVYNFFNEAATLEDTLSILLNIVVLIYFWSIKNKFTS